jgi:hypothetical protein
LQLASSRSIAQAEIQRALLPKGLRPQGLTLNGRIHYDWEAREWNVPINLFVTPLFKVGKQPMSLQVGRDTGRTVLKMVHTVGAFGWRTHYSFLSETIRKIHV